MCHYNHKLLRRLYSLYLNEKYCDLTIKLVDGEMKAHTVVLLASSDCFEGMISSEGTLVLNNVKRNEMKLIIEFIYLGKFESQNPNEVEEIRKLLNQFGLCDDNTTEYSKQFPTKCSKMDFEDNITVKPSEKIPVSAVVKSMTSEDGVQGRIPDSERDIQDDLCLSRNILKEAYNAAMDMELTDTDGVNSADNLDTDRDNTNSSANKRSKNFNDDESLGSTGKSLIVNANKMDVIKTDTLKLDRDISQQKNTRVSTSEHHEEGDSGLNNSVTQIDSHSNFIGTKENSGDGQITHKTGAKRKRTRDLKFQSTSDIVKGLRSRTKKQSCKTSTEKTIHKPDENDSEQNSLEKRREESCDQPISESDLRELGKDEIDNSSDATHVQNQGTKIQHACPECRHVFKSFKLLAGHRHSKHGVALDSLQFEVHKCKECDYETLEVHRLASHRATSHSTSRPYVCEWCGKNFKLLGALTLHTNIHTKARKHECPQCHKSFSQHGTMKRHIEEKHRHSHRHTCELCNFSVQDRVKLIQHKYSVHSEPLPPGYTIYKCSEDGCKFETFRKQIYTGHLNSHKGIQEYTCDVCQKQFASIGNLRSHRTVHKEKSLTCPYPGCEFSTQLRNRLAQHTRLIHTHRDEKPHGCPFCPYKTAVKGNLLKHQRNIHSAANLQSKGDNSDTFKGDNSILMGDNSAVQMSSESILKSLVYSSGNMELYDATNPSDTPSQLLVNGEVIFDTITVLGLQQNNEDKT